MTDLSKYLGLPKADARALAESEDLHAIYREISYVEMRDGSDSEGVVFGLEHRSMEDQTVIVYDIMVDGKIIHSMNPFRIHYLDKLDIYDKDGKRLYAYYFTDYEEQRVLVGYTQLTREALEEVTLRARQCQEKKWEQQNAIYQRERNGEISEEESESLQAAVLDDDSLDADWERSVVKEFGLFGLNYETAASMRP